MTPYQLEELENIRRTAERGKAYSEYFVYEQHATGLDCRDCFLHILDQVERIKNNNNV